MNYQCNLDKKMWAEWFRHEDFRQDAVYKFTTRWTPSFVASQEGTTNLHSCTSPSKLPHMTFTLHPQLAADSIIVGVFPVSLLLMINDAAYPWFVLVPQVADIKDSYQLSEEQHMAVTRESRALCFTLMAAFPSEKMNVAALGNMVPQLHIHHIVRTQSDAAWPAPVWGVQDLTPMHASEITARLDVLKRHMPDGFQFTA